MKPYLKHLYHSGYFIRDDQAVYVFDYWDKVPNLPIFPELDYYFFVSHHHHDHFSPSIFDFSEKINGRCFYIISEDVKSAMIPSGDIISFPTPIEVERAKTFYREEVIVLAPGEQCDLDTGVTVVAFGSTDQGNSYLAYLPYFTVFHAGDLNDWIWKNDSPEEQQRMHRAFVDIVDTIADHERDIDIAFFPVDPRLQEHSADGLLYFINTVHPSVVFPLHFHDRYNYLYEFKKKYRPLLNAGAPKNMNTHDILQILPNNQQIIELDIHYLED